MSSLLSTRRDRLKILFILHGCVFETIDLGLWTRTVSFVVSALVVYSRIHRRLVDTLSEVFNSQLSDSEFKLSVMTRSRYQGD